MYSATPSSYWFNLLFFLVKNFKTNQKQYSTFFTGFFDISLPRRPNSPNSFIPAPLTPCITKVPECPAGASSWAGAVQGSHAACKGEAAENHWRWWGQEGWGKSFDIIEITCNLLHGAEWIADSHWLFFFKPPNHHYLFESASSYLMTGQWDEGSRWWRKAWSSELFRQQVIFQCRLEPWSHGHHRMADQVLCASGISILLTRILWSCSCRNCRELVPSFWSKFLKRCGWL